MKYENLETLWKYISYGAAIISFIGFAVTLWVIWKEKRNAKGFQYAKNINDFNLWYAKKVAKKVYVNINDGKREIVNIDEDSKKVLTYEGEGYWVYDSPDAIDKLTPSQYTGFEKFNTLQSEFLEKQLLSQMLNSLRECRKIKYNNFAYSIRYLLDDTNLLPCIEAFLDNCGAGYCFSYEKIDGQSNSSTRSYLTFYFKPSTNSLIFIDSNATHIMHDCSEIEIEQCDQLKKISEIIKLNFTKLKDYKKSIANHKYGKKKKIDAYKNQLKINKKIKKHYSKLENIN